MSHLTTGNTLGFLLTDTARLFRQFFEKNVTENGLGLTPGEIRALANTVRFRGSRQAVLAERMGVEPMTLSSYLDRLESRGLVARTVDPADRRAKLVEPTDAAFDILDQLDPLFEDVYLQATHGLEEAQVDAMSASLRIIRANLTNDHGLLAEMNILSRQNGTPGDKAD
ncbi:MarR family winged helix-turn-helix transcriptional regulator [Aureimonas mangrovi]|uniref:MarR family winged helix-turn-helix transcriptional regulator n=1 Tax=Aureimonas mangrovi TaxID=2758041 RepID=UPI00163DC795|nr:MarR family transcriptional regulator [Aureimonas mangrovi]